MIAFAPFPSVRPNTSPNTSSIRCPGRSFMIVISTQGSFSGDLAPEPAAVEALDVREELVEHRVARRHGLDLELAGARRTVELAELRPVGVRAREARVDLPHR